MLNLRVRAEQYLGGPIASEEFERAEPYARHKLNSINDREKTSHGDEYLAILLSEIVRGNRFSDYTFACSMEKEIERAVKNNLICQQCGKCGHKKKAAPSFKGTTSLINTAIITLSGSKVNTEVQQ